MLNLFNSFGNSQSSFFGSMSVSDYASIRNGSYNKLLKAYYAKDSSVGSSSQSTSSTRKSGEKNYWDYNEKIKNPPKKKYNYWNYNEKIKGESATPGEKFVDIKNAAANLQSATNSMGKSGEISYDAVSSFVSKYNELNTAAKNSGSVAINSSLRSIADYTKSNADALAEIGITMDKDGVLKINKDTFQSASTDKVDALFKGSNSYGAKVGSRAAAIQSNARYEASKYGIKDTASSSSFSSSSSSSSSSTGSVTSKPTTSNGQLSTVRSNASALSETTDSLVKGTVFKTDDEGKYDNVAIYNAVNDFVKKYNSTVESAGKSNVFAIKNVALASMTDAAKANSSKLEEIGIKIDAKNKTLSIDEEKLKAADPEKIKKLFAGDFGKKVSDRAAAISSHANYEINKGGMYNSNGGYNASSKSGFEVIG